MPQDPDSNLARRMPTTLPPLRGIHQSSKGCQWENRTTDLMRNDGSDEVDVGLHRSHPLKQLSMTDLKQNASVHQQAQEWKVQDPDHINHELIINYGILMLR